MPKSDLIKIYEAYRQHNVLSETVGPVDRAKEQYAANLKSTLLSVDVKEKDDLLAKILSNFAGSNREDSFQTLTNNIKEFFDRNLKVSQAIPGFSDEKFKTSIDKMFLGKRPVFNSKSLNDKASPSKALEMQPGGQYPQ